MPPGQATRPDKRSETRKPLASECEEGILPRRKLGARMTTGQAPYTGRSTQHSIDRRREGKRLRGALSSCPFHGFFERTKKMRDQVTQYHLHPIFRRSVPLVVEPTRMRFKVFDWIVQHFLGERATLADLVQDVPASKVFRDPKPGITSKLNELCRFVG